MSSLPQTLAAAIEEEAPRSVRVLLRLAPSDALALDQFAAHADLTRAEAVRAMVRAGLALATTEEVDPTTAAFALQEELNDLQEARLNGAEVSPLEVLELEARLDTALAAEAALSEEVAF